jgi:hypothetical protein
MRTYITIALTLLLFGMIGGCGSDKKEPTPEAADRMPAITPRSVTEVAGLHWILPQEWQPEAERPMRVATYSTPIAEGDTYPGEVAIFYFGPAEGGSIESNVDRWLNQFEHPDDKPVHQASSREKLTVNGIPVTIVRTTGTYTAVAGPMAPQQDRRSGYKLIGAIAEGPQGAVFFKYTGPIETVDKGEEQFLGLVQSISKR